MSIILYNLFLKIYAFGIRMVARKGNKAQLWLEGRKDIFEKIAASLGKDESRIWIHCASLGEFEQGRPIIEKIQNSKFKIQNAQPKIVLTFFSPSGFEIRKNYESADYVFYLPMDGKQNAKRFIELINPSLAIFVKYEFWYYYLQTLHQQQIPTILVSAVFRESQPFFKWYGGLFRKMLSFYDHLFVQDEPSKNLLSSVGVDENVTVAGDTRYDRVADIASQAKAFPLIEQFVAGKKILVAGSTWKDDELLLRSCLDYLLEDWKLIVAPHEIHEEHLKQVEVVFDGNIIRYSKLNNAASFEDLPKILLIDNIGMLSSLYRYGSVAYVGGGFGTGIHNILEAAIYGLPVFFGPNYQRFIEARDMVEMGFAFSVNGAREFKGKLEKITSQADTGNLRKEIQHYMQGKLGATTKILSYVQTKFR